MERRLYRSYSEGGIVDEALELIMAHLEDPRDRSAVSLVCKKWYRVDARTRKHVTVPFCYTIKPSGLSRRFPRLESLKLKGKPRAAVFDLIPPDWGGYAAPWLKEISHTFLCLKALHLRRMEVSDDDLITLAHGRGHMLQVLKLEVCSGFSTTGLLEIARCCRLLRVLFLEESPIEDRGGEWLHELATNNNVLEVLNFFLTMLDNINMEDLNTIAKKCKSLRSLKINEYCDLSELSTVFANASALEEFGGGIFTEENTTLKYQKLKFSPKVTSLSGLNDMGESHLTLLLPHVIRKLDLKYTRLSTEGHCQLLQSCVNLEQLEVLNVVGDRGLQVLADNCKKLRRLRIEPGDDDIAVENGEASLVSHKGLSIVAQGCLVLEFVAMYVIDITNAALADVGRCCKNLRDFRIVLLDKVEEVTDLPLDNGVKELLLGCPNLTRFGLYLRPGALSDIGLEYVGKYTENVRWMLLGCVGETNRGLLAFSEGCPKLERLELRACHFNEEALSAAVLNLRSLKYMWVQGFKATTFGVGLLAMERPFWIIEFTPEHINEEGELQPAQILAYYSLAGIRTDHPQTVIPLTLSSWSQQQMLTS